MGQRKKSLMARAKSKVARQEAKKAKRKRPPKTIRNENPFEYLRRLGLGEFKDS